MLRNSSKERIICYSLIFVLLSALIYFIFIGNEEYVEDYNIKIEALEAKVDSLHNINDDLVFKIDTLNKEIIKLDKEIIIENYISINELIPKNIVYFNKKYYL